MLFAGEWSKGFCWSKSFKMHLFCGKKCFLVFFTISKNNGFLIDNQWVHWKSCKSVICNLQASLLNRHFSHQILFVNVTFVLHNDIQITFMDCLVKHPLILFFTIQKNNNKIILTFAFCCKVNLDAEKKTAKNYLELLIGSRIKSCHNCGFWMKNSFLVFFSNKKSWVTTTHIWIKQFTL